MYTQHVTLFSNLTDIESYHMYPFTVFSPNTVFHVCLHGDLVHLIISFFSLFSSTAVPTCLLKKAYPSKS